MKLFALTILCSLSVAPLFCSQYAGLSMGTNNSLLTSESHDPKIGYQLGAKYGYDFDNGFRTELAIGYKKNDFKTKYTSDDQDNILSREYRSLYSMNYMANGFYDFKQVKFMEVTPYVGIGIGLSQNSEKNKIKKDAVANMEKYRDSRFAYQAIAGAKYDINANYSAAVEYHYCCSRSHAKDHSVDFSVVRSF